MNFKQLLILVNLFCLPLSLAIKAPIALSADEQLVAQAFLDDRCPDQYVYLLGFTKNYRVVICGKRDTGKPTHYLGVSRRNGSHILLPLNAHTSTRFFARNGRYTYTLDLTTQTLTLGASGDRPRIETFTPETP